MLLGTGQEVLFQILSAILWIRFWGASLYSEWLMISLLPLLVIRGNTGVFHTATSELIRQTHQNDREGAAATFKNLLLSEAVFLAGVALIYALATGLIIVLTEPAHFSSWELWGIVSLYLFQFLLFQRQQSLLCLVKANRDPGRAIGWQNGFRLAFIVPMLGISAFAGPIVCLILAVVSQSLVYAATEARFRHLRQKIAGHPTRANLGNTRKLAVDGLLFSLFPLGHTATHTVSVWAVSLFFGPMAGAAYHNMRTIARSVVLVAKAIEMTLRLELSGLFANHETQKSDRLVDHALILTGLASAAIVVPLLFRGELLFAFMTQGELSFYALPFTLLCLAALFHAISQVYLGVTFSVNKHASMTRRYFGALGLLLLVIAPSAQAGLVTLSAITLLAELVMLYTARDTANALIKQAKAA